jgi:hypothetical protein
MKDTPVHWFLSLPRLEIRMKNLMTSLIVVSGEKNCVHLLSFLKSLKSLELVWCIWLGGI